MQPVEKKYYYIDGRINQKYNEFSDEYWIELATENGEKYILTEQEYEEHKDDEGLRYFVYRYL